MEEIRSHKTQISKVNAAAKRKTTDEEVVEATPPKTPGEVVEMPDEQAEEPKKSGKKKPKKKNAEEAESDHKNGGKSEGDQKNVDKLEAGHIRDEEKMKIDKGISEIDRMEMGQDGAKETSHIVECKRENQEKRGKKRKNQNRQKEVGANKRSGEGLMVNGEKGAELKGMEGETNADKKRTTYTDKEINNLVEMNTDSEKPMGKRMKKSLEFFQRCKDAKKMKRDKEEMGQEGGKENSHIVENKGENEKKRGKKRKNQNRQIEEGANKTPGEGQMVNGEKGAEFKGMEGETNVKKKQTTYTNKEINTFVDMNTDNEKSMGKKLKSSSECFQKYKEKKVRRDADKMKIDQEISDKVEMEQEDAKENSNIVESKRGNEKKRGKKRKKQNKEIGEGANKSSGEGQMVNGEKGSESKGRVGEMNAKKKQTPYTKKEINNSVEMNIVNGKPMAKKPKGKKRKVKEPLGRKQAKARKFFQKCKEKKWQLIAEKMKIHQGISE